MSGSDRERDHLERPADQPMTELGEIDPKAQFPASAIRGRIADSIAAEPGSAVADVRPTEAPQRGWWLLQAAAAILLFGGGLLVGRWSTPAPDPGVTFTDFPEVARQSSSSPGSRFEPGHVPLSIQQAGTSYVTSLALFSEMNAQLSPEQRRQAREVALAVLSGAIAELLVSTQVEDAPLGGDDELQLSGELLELLRAGARSETADETAIWQ